MIRLSFGFFVQNRFCSLSGCQVYLSVWACMPSALKLEMTVACHHHRLHECFHPPHGAKSSLWSCIAFNTGIVWGRGRTVTTWINKSRNFFEQLKVKTPRLDEKCLILVVKLFSNPLRQSNDFFLFISLWKQKEQPRLKFIRLLRVVFSSQQLRE